MVRLIQLDKHLYCVGLNWHSFTKSNIPTQCTEYYDVYTVSRTPKQIGLAYTKRNEAFLKSQSLSSMLKRSDETFIAVLSLKDVENNDIYWVYSMDNGQITGFGDYVCDSIDKVNEALNAIKDFSTIEIEPTFYNYDESINYIKNNLNTTQKFFTTQAIKPLYPSKLYKKKKSQFLVILLFCFAIIYGVMRYSDFKNIQELRSAALFSKQSTENQIKNIYANTHKYFPMDWKDNNYPNDIYNVCKPQLFSLPIIENGWVLEKAICTPNEMQSFWRHEKQASFVDLPFDGVLVNPKLARAKHNIQEISLKQNNIDHNALLPQEEATKLLYQLTQNMGANLALSFEKEAVKEFKDLKISILSPFKKGNFEWKSVPSSLLLNSSLFKAISSIPSLSVKKIEYNNGQWSIHGDLYVKS